MIIKNAYNKPLEGNICQSKFVICSFLTTTNFFRRFQSIILSLKQNSFSWYLYTSFILSISFAIFFLFPTISIAGSIDKGATYLQISQRAGGSWVSNETRQVHATIEALLGLQATGGNTTVRTAAADFLEANTTDDTDALARRIIALSAEGRDVTLYINQLLSVADPLGGWGLKPEYSADPLDTALALSALANGGHTDAAEVEEALLFLVASQNPDGGWACVERVKPISTSDVSCTAQSLITLIEYRTFFDVESHISAAQEFLRTQIQSDGSIGGIAADPIYTTALSLLALIKSGGALGDELFAIVTYFESQQRTDGSWGDDPLFTAVVLRALIQVKTPLITSLPITTTTNTEGTYSYSVVAKDIDNDDLTFSLIESPAGMTIDPLTGLVQWTPSVGQDGHHTITVKVQDINNLFRTQTFTILVVNSSTNVSPFITSTPIASVIKDTLYIYDVEATDPDVSDKLKYLLVTAPLGMTIIADTGMIHWQAPLQMGAFDVMVRVEDMMGEFDSQTFIITVGDPIVVPDVVGKTRVEAENIILNASLSVRVFAQSSDKVPAGYVISQNPSSGSAISVSSKVDIVVSSSTGLVFVESEDTPDQFVIEAETFSSRTSSESHSWIVFPDESADFPTQFSNYRGSGYVLVLPDVNGGSAPLSPPFIEYTVCVETVGDYQLYVRWGSLNNSGDTLYASIVELNDGIGGAIADWYRYVRISNSSSFTDSWFGHAGFEKTDSPFSNGETPAVWTILKPGAYTIRFDMREDGAAIDAFIFQRTNLPFPSGNGPSPSKIINDNICGSDLTIAQIDKSNLVFDGQGLTVSGDISAILTNLGRHDVNTPFEVLFFEDRNDNGNYDLSIDNILGFTNVTTSLHRGESITVTADMSGSVLFSENLIWGFVDSTDAIGETNETNNLANSGEKCVMLPDLTTSFVRITEESGTVLITARVGNGGAIPVSADTQISFYDGNPASDGVLLGTVNIPGTINPGKFSDVTFNLTNITPSSDSIWVVADDSGGLTGIIDECEEANNIYDLGLKITLPVIETPIDNDGDGYFSNLDCNDINPAVNPGVKEILGNGIDDDCNPATPDTVLQGEILCTVTTDKISYGAQEDIQVGLSLERVDTLKNGLVAFYPFNGNADDGSGNNNNGMVNGATLTMDRFGNPNSAYSFDGVNDYIDIGKNVKPPFPLSVSVWINANDLDARGCGSAIVVRNDQYDGDSHRNGLTLRVNNGILTAHYFEGFSASWNRVGLASNDTLISVGNWHHLVVKFNSHKDIQLFVNGIEDFGSYDDGTGSGMLYSNDGHGAIGMLKNGNKTCYFNGIVDELRFYNRALSESEIQKLYSFGTIFGLVLKVDAQHEFGESLGSVSEILVPFAPGDRQEISFSFPTGSAPPGNVLVTAQVLSGTDIVTSCSANAPIESSIDKGVRLTGSISAQSNDVFLGDEVKLQYSVTNIGNTTIDPVNLEILIIDSSTSQQVGTTLLDFTTLGLGQTFDDEIIAPQDLPVGEFIVILRGGHNNDLETLSSAILSIKNEQVIINNFVTFEPIRLTYKSTTDPSGCPEGYVGQFSFKARLENISNSTFDNLAVEFKELTNGNLLKNSDGGTGKKRTKITIPKTDDYSDGILSPGESIDVYFEICLKEWEQLGFFVDVLGVPSS